MSCDYKSDVMWNRHKIACDFMLINKPKMIHDFGGSDNFLKFYKKIFYTSNCVQYVLFDKIIREPKKLLKLHRVHYQKVDLNEMTNPIIFDKFMKDEDEEFANIFSEFDLTIAFEVMEHLLYPENFAKFLMKGSKKGDVILLSLPNDYCWDVRLRFLFGKDVLNQYSNNLPSDMNHKIILKPSVSDNWLKKLFKGFKVEILDRDPRWSGAKYLPQRVRKYLANRLPDVFCRCTTYKITNLRK